MKFRLRKLISFKFFWILFGVLTGLAVLGTVGFIALSRWVNSVRLPEELKKTPAALQARMDQLHRPPTISRDELLKLKNYDEYLRVRLAHDPGLKSIPLYFELGKSIYAGNIRKSIENLKGFRDGGVSESQLAEWLDAHADFLDLLHRFAQAGPLPQPTLEERMDYAKTSYPFFASVLSTSSFRILCMLALQRARDKKYGEARQALEDCLLFTENYRDWGGIISLMLALVGIDNATGAARSMFEDPEFPATELRALIPVMEGTEKSLLPPGRFSDVLLRAYAVERAGNVAQMEVSGWKSCIYGWQGGSTPIAVLSNNRSFYFDYIKITRNRGIPVPNVRLIVRDGSAAMRNRVHAAEALRKFDHFIQGQVEFARLSRPERELEKTKLQVSDPNNNFLINTQAIVNKKSLYSRLLQMDTAVANLHLARLGAMLRVNTTSTLALRGKDLHADPFNPWRDPFTDKPFEIEKQTTQTLIYSPGPDPQDKNGRIDIRVPR